MVNVIGPSDFDMGQPLSSPASAARDRYDVKGLVRGLYADGIIACKAAFSREWAAQMADDISVAFEEARGREGGTVGRGPHRYYVEIHPEQLRGFTDLVTHPWVTAVCEAVLGPGYSFVEVGFDVPFPGAQNQPWHRDFPSPRETWDERRLTSLAFNLTAVDVIPEMGPFEIAVGTQFKRGEHFNHGMFPPENEWPRYASLGQLKLPQLGDISARSALTIHRGTANRSHVARPVLILGADAPGPHEARHDMHVSRAFYDTLPDYARHHLLATVVDRLEPVVQKHSIEGLVMGAP
ncbi:MAG TPA: phytanoyl-CoA dioxygenase family protein [Propionibacteriaceae bacterium]